MEIYNFQEIDENLKKLIFEAEEAASHVYPRNRDVAIGAVLISGNRVYTGANIGRRAFNNSTCAERMALDKALFDGISRIDRIVIIGINKAHPFEEVIAPCGACRQILFEAISRLNQEDLELILCNSNKTKIIKTTLHELLPLVYENAKRE
jgi:cytidine deaminase